MSQRPRINVVWFKCTDLRTHDHAPLRAAHSQSLPVMHLYIFDPFWHSGRTRICKLPKTGVLRTRFQLEALADLKSRLQAMGHDLTTRSHISSAKCFEELCKDYVVNAVFAFHEVCSEELRIERQVANVLRRSGGGNLNLFWGFELYHHDDLDFDPKRGHGPFNSYTAFRKRVEGLKIRDSARESPAIKPGKTSLEVRWSKGDVSLPGLQEVMGANYKPQDDNMGNKDPRAELLWRGGETAALARIQEFFWDDDCLGLDYVGATMTTDPSKSCMRDKAMSKLSPWLAHGCISPRRLHEEVRRYERQRCKTKSTYWITHEMLWRDFVRFASLNAGTRIFKIGGIRNTQPTWRWSQDQSWLNAWISGTTGFPFVDCFMRELKATGYCNHMGRECAGWFLIGDLGIDWRMGAEWFESVLLDYEPTANWYNWAYRCLPAAGRSETPGERLHGLEILKWGTQHDPDATYIKRWIPELATLPATVAREPWRLGLLDDAEGSLAERGLRELPKDGQISVSKDALEVVASMGFSQSDAAMALHRAWGDVDGAVALLLGENEVSVSNEQSSMDEDDDLQRAIQLSLSAQSPNASEAHRTQASSGKSEVSNKRFKYGVDYPKPIIAPVSLVNTEQEEEAARREQARRDSQIADAKCRSSGSRSSAPSERHEFNKQRWEQERRQRPAETPTGAQVATGSWRGDRQGNHRAHTQQPPELQPRPQKENATGSEATPDVSRKRRWRENAKGGWPNDAARGA
mmetsp:Transcript_62236/g.148506  ORF Transcript_62236/g.148506 Transcript_62236/m.148506 type:complete len:747 (+) Transcript_62236:116-2356(+)